MKVKIGHPDIPSVIRRITGVSIDTHHGVLDVLELMGGNITSDQAVITPMDTGELAEGNEFEVVEIPTGFELNFWNDVLHSSYVEFGTGFRGENSPPEFLPEGLEWPYSVNRPWEGYEARPYFYPPLIAGSDELLDELIEKITEVMKNED